MDIALTKSHYVIISIALVEFSISRPGVKLLLFPFIVVSLDGRRKSEEQEPLAAAETQWLSPFFCTWNSSLSGFYIVALR